MSKPRGRLVNGERFEAFADALGRHCLAGKGPLPKSLRCPLCGSKLLRVLEVNINATNTHDKPYGDGGPVVLMGTERVACYTVTCMSCGSTQETKLTSEERVI